MRGRATLTTVASTVTTVDPRIAAIRAPCLRDIPASLALLQSAAMAPRLLLLGATGSIGTQALDVLARTDDLEIVGLSAGRAGERAAAAGHQGLGPRRRRRRAAARGARARPGRPAQRPRRRRCRGPGRGGVDR